MGNDIDRILLQVSCVLSGIGSLITMLVCSQIGVSQKRKGRDLIFWLSFTDFATSVVYLMSSLETNKDGKNSTLCQTYALLGIFFPVASFLWTDFIAYYLYDMVVNRQSVDRKDWSRSMISFHTIAWGTSFLCIILVGTFGHAGEDSDVDNNNTGGWCWVYADSSKELLLWELVGGKFVEWTSCLLVLPYFYSVTIMRLMALDNGWNYLMADNDTVQSGVMGVKDEPKTWLGNILTPFAMCYNSYMGCMKSKEEVQAPLKEDLFSNEDISYAESPFRLSDNNLSSMVSVSESENHETSFAHAHSNMESHQCVAGVHSVENSSVGNTISELTSDASTICSEHSNTKDSHSAPSFRQFYLKMAIVPMVFFLCRIWGSVRLIIHFTSSSTSSAASASSSWLQTAQAIFDPSQGFFNAFIFVLMSQQDRDAFWEVLFNAKHHCFLVLRTSCLCTLIWGKHEVPPKSPENSTTARNNRLSNKNILRYQGEDSMDSDMSESIDCNNSSSLVSSYIGLDENSFTSTY